MGGASPCWIIAEAGINHDGDPDLAHVLVDVAADAGADAVKFQTFDASELAVAGSSVAPYQASAGASDPVEMLEALMLPQEVWVELAAHARDRGLIFLSTPFDVVSAEMLADLGVPALKVPSGELDNLPYLSRLAGLGLPLVVSTGMGTVAEVATALDAVSDAPAVALLHCVSAYPAPPSEANLRAIPAMVQEFAVPVGWSDHTQGWATAVAAVALGASIIEKHFTTDPRRPGPDHAASASPEELGAYINAVHVAERALGDGVKRSQPSEEENRRFARRGLYAARDLAAGEPLTPGAVVARRPADSLSPATLRRQLRTRVPIPCGAAITADLVEEIGRNAGPEGQR